MSKKDTKSASKKQDAKKDNKDEKDTKHLVDYSPKDETAQAVIAFGHDKHSRRARAVFHIMQYMFCNMKKDRVHPKELLNFCIEKLQVDFSCKGCQGVSVERY